MSMAKSITGGIGALVIGAVLFVAGGAIAIFIGKPILDNAKASESWPDVPGVVVSSDVVSKRGKDNTMYSADIVYHYAVNGRDYTCSTVSFGGNYSSSSSQHAHKVTNKYPAGTPVQVYYQPEEPSTAALEPGATAMSYFALGIGCVFVLVGGLMCAVPLF